MATYLINRSEPIQITNPTVKRVGGIPQITIKLRPDSSLTLKVDCSIVFEAIDGVVGDITVGIENMSVNNLNGDEGNIEDRIWDYLNDPQNGYIVTS